MVLVWERIQQMLVCLSRLLRQRSVMDTIVINTSLICHWAEKRPGPTIFGNVSWGLILAHMCWGIPQKNVLWGSVGGFRRALVTGCVLRARKLGSNAPPPLPRKKDDFFPRPFAL